MKKVVFSNVLKTGTQMILLLAICCFGLGSGGTTVARGQTTANADACGQQLADAEAQFQATLLPDGSVPASLEARAAAAEYIRVSKICYEQVEAQNLANGSQGDTPTFIDEGGVLLDSGSSGDFVLTNSKWGSSTLGTAGGHSYL